MHELIGFHARLQPLNNAGENIGRNAPIHLRFGLRVVGQMLPETDARRIP